MPLPLIPVIASVAGRALMAGGKIAPWLASTANAMTPKFEDEVTVEVVGQPGATKQNLYYLALSVACGLVRRYDFGQGWLGFPPGLIMLEYDPSDNWVRATLRYRTSTLTSGLNPFSPNISDSFLFVGPPETVIGAPFNFAVGGVNGQKKIGIPAGKNIPILPFTGQTILTSFPMAKAGGAVVPAFNPKPSGDKRSRGSAANPAAGTGSGGNPPISDWLIPLVFAALSDPGSQNMTSFTGSQGGTGGR